MRMWSEVIGCVRFLMKIATIWGTDIMKNLITAMALAIVIAFTGQLQAQQSTSMSVEEVQQATVSTQGSVPEGSLGPEVILWSLLGIVFITALATAGGGGAAAPAPAPS